MRGPISGHERQAHTAHTQSQSPKRARLRQRQWISSGSVAAAAAAVAVAIAAWTTSTESPPRECAVCVLWRILQKKIKIMVSCENIMSQKINRRHFVCSCCRGCCWCKPHSFAITHGCLNAISFIISLKKWSISHIHQ